MTRARELIEAAEEPLGLDDLAQALEVSPGHLQRTFKRVTGVSPRQYAEAQRLGRFKDGLRNGDDVASATYEAGFGSSSRVYEKAAPMLGMTPAFTVAAARGMAIDYTMSDSAMGPLLVASTERGVCFVGFAKSESAASRRPAGRIPEASISGTGDSHNGASDAIRCFIDGRCRDLDLPLDLKGTDFQLLVWQALRSIPYGETRSYRQVAEGLDRPTAARAVARACATNPCRSSSPAIGC